MQQVKLSNQQTRIFFEMCKGKTVTDLCEEWDMSLGAIGTQLARIRKKTGSRTNIQAFLRIISGIGA
jgi:DNA-binding NarL/FixJ family response regulator